MSPFSKKNLPEEFRNKELATNLEKNVFLLLAYSMLFVVNSGLSFIIALHSLLTSIFTIQVSS